MSFKEISSIFLHFGAESNIGTSILPRRKVKKMPKELEAQANKPIIQVTNGDQVYFSGTAKLEKGLFTWNGRSGHYRPQAIHVSVCKAWLKNHGVIQSIYTESDSKIGMWEGGALNLCQAQPVLQQLNLKSLAMEAGHKFSGCPTSPEPIFESRAVYMKSPKERVRKNNKRMIETVAKTPRTNPMI